MSYTCLLSGLCTSSDSDSTTGLDSSILEFLDELRLQDGDRVFTSATHDTMDSIRRFSSDDRGVEIPMAMSVCGNIMVVLHHIWAIPVAKKAGMVSRPTERTTYM